MSGGRVRSVSTTPDLGRFAAALSVAGIDPRTWIAKAHVVRWKFDEEQGAIVDVRVLPFDEYVIPAQVAPAYAGDGFGFWLPLDVDDEVIVSFIDGIVEAGLEIIGRTWSRADKPPKLAVDNPADVVLVVRNKKHLRMRVSGGGTVQIGGGNVVLADGTDGSNGSADQAVVRKGDRMTASTQMGAWAGVVEAAVNALAPGTFTPLNKFTPAGAPPPHAANPGAPGAFGAAAEGSKAVKAGGGAG